MASSAGPAVLLTPAVQYRCNTRRLDHIYRDPHNGEDVRLYLHYGDIGSSGNLADIIRQVAPDEIHHLGR